MKNNIKSLFAEARLVFMSPPDKPGPKPPAPKPVAKKPDPKGEALSGIQKLAQSAEKGEKPPTVEDVQRNMKTIVSHIRNKITELRAKGLDRGQYDPVVKKLIEIEKKIKAIIDVPKAKRKDTHKQTLSAINAQLRVIAKKLAPKPKAKPKSATGKVPKTEPDPFAEGIDFMSSPSAKPKKTVAKKPKESPDKGPSEFADTPEGNVSAFLDKVFARPDKRFNYKEIRQLKILVAKLNLQKPTQKNTDKTTLLPGGYSINMANWGSPRRPSMVISKGEHVMLVEVNGSWLPPRLVEDNVMNLVNVMRSLSELKGVFKDFDQNQNTFSNPTAIKAFQRSMKDLATNTWKAPWSKPYPELGAKIDCQKMGNGHGVFKVVIGKTKFIYDTHYPDKFITEKVVKGKKKYLYASIEPSTDPEKSEKALRKKEKSVEGKKAKENAEHAKDKHDVARAKLAKSEISLRNKEIAEKNSTVYKLLGKTNKEKYAKPIKGKPNSFEVKGDVGSLRIHQLIDLKANANKFIKIQIGKKIGVYYPGQKSIFRLDSRGKRQISTNMGYRMKFDKGDIIKVLEYRDPQPDDLKYVHYRWKRTKAHLSKMKTLEQDIKQEKIKEQISKTEKSISRFLKVKGEYEDLAKFKTDPELKETLAKLTGHLGEDPAKGFKSLTIDRWKTYLSNNSSDKKYVENLQSLFAAALVKVSEYKSKYDKPKAGQAAKSKSGGSGVSKLFG